MQPGGAPSGWPCKKVLETQSMSEVQRLVEEATARAASRAAVLQGLQLAFQSQQRQQQQQRMNTSAPVDVPRKRPKTSHSSTATKLVSPPSSATAPVAAAAVTTGVENNVENKPVTALTLERQRALQQEWNSSKAQLDNTIDFLMSHLVVKPTGQSISQRLSKNQREDRMRSHFTDALSGKAVVLSNVSLHKKANNSEKRKKRKAARVARMSQRQMKHQSRQAQLMRSTSEVMPSEQRCLSLGLPCSLSSMSLTILQQLWHEYATRLQGTCHSDAQLQVKLLGLELVGAPVRLVNYLCPRQGERPLARRSARTDASTTTTATTAMTANRRERISPAAGQEGIVVQASKDTLTIQLTHGFASGAVGGRAGDVVRIERKRSLLAIYLPQCTRTYAKKRHVHQKDLQEYASTVDVNIDDTVDDDEKNDDGDNDENENEIDQVEGEEMVVGEAIADAKEATDAKPQHRGRILLVRGSMFQPQTSAESLAVASSTSSSFVVSNDRHFFSTVSTVTSKRVL